MAITLNIQNRAVVSLEEFLEYVQTKVDLRDIDGIGAAAHMLRGLTNERELVVREINRQVKNAFRTRVAASTQVLFLGSGNGFYVRANLWPSSADLSMGRVLQDHFSYHIAHDHNYHFLTAAYHGPGYFTDIYEYDSSKVEGFAGERVALRFTERVHFQPGMVMLYEASKDVHTQQPPDELSITLNLMVNTPNVRLRDQYYFDLETQTLIDAQAGIDSSVRESIIKMAAHVGDDNTRQLLRDLSRDHPSRRTRLAAFEALVELDPSSQTEIWEMACRDREVLVAQAGRDALTSLQQHSKSRASG